MTRSPCPDFRRMARSQRLRNNPLRLLVVGTAWPPQTFLGRLMRGLADRGSGSRSPFPNGRTRTGSSNPSSGPSRREPGKVCSHPARLAGLASGRGCSGPRAPCGSSGSSPLAEVPVGAFGSEPAPALCRGAVRRHLLPLEFGGNRLPAALRDRQARRRQLPRSQVNVAPHDPRRSVREGLPVTFRKASLVHCVSRAIKSRPAVTASTRTNPGSSGPVWTPRSSAPPRSVEPPIAPYRDTAGSNGTRGHLRPPGPPGAGGRGRPAVFSIIGDGPDRQRILFAIDDLGLRDTFGLLGRRAPTAVAGRAARSDIFVLPSLTEGLSNAGVEAMGCGVPVVLTDAGGAREACRRCRRIPSCPSGIPPP